jgi:hypothetical protein
MARAALLALIGLCACGAKGEPRRAEIPADRWPLVRLLASDALAGRAPGSEGSAKARRGIIAEMKRCGVVPPPGRDGFEQATNGPGINVVGHLPGSEAGRYVVLSAHYDHLGVVAGEIMNGADDNAAAVGSVLAVACELAKRPRKATLIVALWDTEEPPYFLTAEMGSRHWVENPHVPLAEVEAAIVLDLVGAGLWPGSPVHVALGAESSPELARLIDETPVPDGLRVAQAGLHLVERLVSGGHQPWSDYHYFRQRQVPFVFLSNGQTAHYHRATDDFDTLDLAKLDRQTRWLTEVVQALIDLQANQRPRWAPFERPELDRRAASELVHAALASGAFTAAEEALRADARRLEEREIDVRAQRAAVQRIQCLAAKHYPRSLCLRL